VAVVRQRHRQQHPQRKDSLDRPDQLARQGSPESRDKRGIQARMVTGGIRATPDDRATPDGRATRVIPETRDRKATPAIEASPLPAPPDSIPIPILTTDG